MRNIEFYFDLVSPYAYLAANYIDRIAEKHNSCIQWNPFRLGITVTKIMEIKPLLMTPLKGPYVMADVQRLASVMGIPMVKEMGLFNPLAAQRLLLSVDDNIRGDLSKRLFQARWAEGLALDDMTVLTELAAGFGIDAEALQHIMDDPESKERVTRSTQQAIDRGVFGSPSCVVDGEIFWGVDRLWLLDHYLANGEQFSPLEPNRAEALGWS